MKFFLDITHAFRSIPLFLYLMLDLMKILQFKNDFKLSGLYYGMQDVINDFGYAPIVDLSPFTTLPIGREGLTILRILAMVIFWQS